MNIKMQLSGIRPILPLEKKEYSAEKFKYITTGEFVYDNGKISIKIPPGFCTDGSSGGPDWGFAWLFHDYLYATHKWQDGTPCTRHDADAIMYEILEYERQSIYRYLFYYLAKINFLYIFESAWESSGKRGPIIMNDLLNETTDLAKN